MARYKKGERDQERNKMRHLLLKTAAAEIARKGYDAANVNHISTDAGFAKGTIYNYFASKEALMIALIDEIAETHLDYITQSMRGEVAPDLRLKRFVEAGFRFVSEHLSEARVAVAITYGPDEGFKQRLYQAYQPMFQFVSKEIIAAGVAKRVFRQVEPDAMAALIMTIYLGTASQVNERGQPWLDPKQVADFALHALRHDSPPRKKRRKSA